MNFECLAAVTATNIIIADGGVVFVIKDVQVFHWLLLMVIFYCLNRDWMGKLYSQCCDLPNDVIITEVN